MSAAPYSDEINRGFEIVKRHLIDVGLWNRISQKQEIDPLFSHPFFSDHYGGVEFDLKMKNIDSLNIDEAISRLKELEKELIR